jgi:hypothetical protein
MQDIRISEIKAGLREAIERDDPKGAKVLVDLWLDAHQLAQRVEAAQRPGSREEGSKQEPAGRSVLIEITRGARTQNYLSVTRAIRKGLMRQGRIRISIPSIRADFETEIAHPGHVLRERRRIREFYEMEGIQEGDYVSLREVAQDTWELKKGAGPLTQTDNEGPRI